MDILTLTAVQLSAHIKDKKITVREAVEAVFEQIEKEEKSLNCYVTLDRDGALAKADALQKKVDAGEALGPLFGVPVAIKDNLCTKGMLTTCASKILYNFIPAYTAEADRKSTRLNSSH